VGLELVQVQVLAAELSIPVVLVLLAVLVLLVVLEVQMVEDPALGWHLPQPQTQVQQIAYHFSTFH
jgi:hypothetical protein